MRTFDRRWLLGGGVALAAAGGAGYLHMNGETKQEDSGAPRIVKTIGGMPYRQFGGTGVHVSEIGFGAWAIGGSSYGAVNRAESLSALARAEELGCNLVDTASVYGDSELVLGDFLAGRRAHWFVATKFSGQDAGMTATLESQLRRLRTDCVDFYMVHWVPRGNDRGLLSELEALKRAGKARFIGVSLYNVDDVDYVLDEMQVDGLMLPFSLLDPDPFLARRQRLCDSGKAVMVRSALKEGFLSGKFRSDTRFTDPQDQRSRWTAERVAQTVERVERFRFLEAEAGSLVRAAIAYPLSFPEVSTVVLGVKNLPEADENFGRAPGRRLSPANLARIAALQRQLKLHESRGWLRRLWSRFS
jgi:myo-inositol catabolism protein IolS